MTRLKKTLLILAPMCLLAVAATLARPAPQATSFLIRDALAADSCTNWMVQPNGCHFRTCVDGGGRQYCEQACGRNAPTRVSCR